MATSSAGTSSCGDWRLTPRESALRFSRSISASRVPTCNRKRCWLQWNGGVFLLLQQRSKHPREVVITEIEYFWLESGEHPRCIVALPPVRFSRSISASSVPTCNRYEHGLVCRTNTVSSQREQRTNIYIYIYIYIYLRGVVVKWARGAAAPHTLRYTYIHIYTCIYMSVCMHVYMYV